MAPTKTKNLAELQPGDETWIVSVDADAPAFLRDRMFALGFVPGTSVRIIRKAPLGDPVEYELRGARISLRKTEARLLTVSDHA